MKKVVLLSHCVLNSFCEMPEASDAFRKRIVDILMEKKISMIQLPCPELCYQALERESIVAGAAKAQEYEIYCKQLLDPMIRNIKEYQKHGISIAGIIGIDTSPSCSVADKNAIMTKILMDQMSELGISSNLMIDMPVTGDGEAFFAELEKL